MEEATQAATETAATTEPAAATETAANTETAAAATETTAVEEAPTAKGNEAEDARLGFGLMAHIRATIAEWDDDLHEALHEDLTAVEKLLGIGG